MDILPHYTISTYDIVLKYIFVGTYSIVNSRLVVLLIYLYKKSNNI